MYYLMKIIFVTSERQILSNVLSEKCACIDLQWLSINTGGILVVTCCNLTCNNHHILRISEDPDPGPRPGSLGKLDPQTRVL